MTIRKLKEEKKEITDKTALLKREFDLLKEKMTDYDDKLKRLFELGIIDENANPINNDMN